MRILFILDEFLPENSGGAANVAFSLAKEFVKLNNDLLVLTATNNPASVGEIKIEGVKIRRIFTSSFGKSRNFKNLKNRAILKETKKVFEEYQPDIIHIHALHHRFSYGVVGLAKKSAKAVFLTLHDAQTVYNGKLYPKRKICDLNPEYDYRVSWVDCLKRDGLSYNPFQRFFIKKALKKIDKIFSVSESLKEALEVNGISNIETVHNGIDAEEWQVKEISGNNILFVGRVDEAKGIRVLIKVFEDISSEVPNAKLTIVGDGEFNAGSNKNIRVLPWQDRENMKRIFSEIKVIIVPSLYLDPFPTVNLEAMVSVKPVVGTCFGGTPEVVKDNETGYIVNPYNEKELAEKIIDLLKNPEKAAQFGNNGRERVKNFFSLKSQIQKTLFWYNKFLSK